jgi:hypothetical protein
MPLVSLILIYKLLLHDLPNHDDVWPKRVAGKKIFSYIFSSVAYCVRYWPYNNIIQGGSNMTGTNCDLFTHNQSRSYLNHLVIRRWIRQLHKITLYFCGSDTQRNILKKFHVLVKKKGFFFLLCSLLIQPKTGQTSGPSFKLYSKNRYFYKTATLSRRYFRHGNVFFRSLWWKSTYRKRVPLS